MCCVEQSIENARCSGIKEPNNIKFDKIFVVQSMPRFLPSVMVKHLFVFLPKGKVPANLVYS